MARLLERLYMPKYGDGEVVKFVLHAGRDLVSSSVVTRFNFTNQFLPASTVQLSQYGGENGMTIEDDGHEIFLFPGGYSGQQVVHAYNYSDNSSSIIEIHCPPRSLVRQQRAGDTIVGHCKRTPYTVFGPAHYSEYQYFKLSMLNGKWMDVSQDEQYNFIHVPRDVHVEEWIRKALYDE